MAKFYKQDEVLEKVYTSLKAHYGKRQLYIARSRSAQLNMM